MSARERLEKALRQLHGAQNAVKDAIYLERLPASTRASLEGTLLRLREDEAFLCRDLATVQR